MIDKIDRYAKYNTQKCCKCNSYLHKNLLTKFKIKIAFSILFFNLILNIFIK